MGNLVSCSAVMSARMGSRIAAARIILPGGETRQLRAPVKAAEIMLEHPTHFLVNAGSLVAGRRFSALSADEDLEFGNVYAVFPMKKLSSVITAADVAVLLMGTHSLAKRLSAGNAKKVSPADCSDETPENDVGRFDVMSGVVVQGFVGAHRLSCRSKKPLLETIIEEPVHTRVNL